MSHIVDHAWKVPVLQTNNLYVEGFDDYVITGMIIMDNYGSNKGLKGTIVNRVFTVHPFKWGYLKIQSI